MATMRDVAVLAGVSITTVSHVVNRTRPIKAATERKVLDAIERTGYTGDAIARSLATGGTHTIGLALPMTTNPHLTALLPAVETAAAAAGYPLMLLDTHDDATGERRAVAALRSRRVDGLLLTPSTAATTALLPELRHAGTPTVLFGRLPQSAGVDAVGPENIQATSALVHHMAELGHTRIGMLRCAADETTSEERVLGYRLGLGRAGLPWDPGLVLGGDLTAESSSEALPRLLRLPRPVTAVVAGDGAALADVVRVARRDGVHIGSDLAVVGHEDAAGDATGSAVTWPELVDPPLTTMSQSLAEMGRDAVTMLLDRIAHPDAEPRATRLPPTLRHRRSCGCPSSPRVRDVPVGE